MNLEKIYNTLKDIKDDHSKMVTFIDDLRLAIIDKDIKESTPAVKWTTIKKLLKASKNRPVLTYIDTSSGDQRFTDSYRAFILKNNDIIKDLHEDYIHSAAAQRGLVQSEYPDLNNIIDPLLKNYHDTYKIKADQLKKLCKVDDFIEFNTSDHTITFQSKYIMDALNILQFKNNDIITFYLQHSNIRPALIKNNNGSIAVVLPIKREDQ